MLYSAGSRNYVLYVTLCKSFSKFIADTSIKHLLNVHVENLDLYMFNIVDTAFSYKRELIFAHFCKTSPREKEVACK